MRSRIIDGGSKSNIRSRQVKAAINNWFGGGAPLDPNVVLVGFGMGQSNESGRGEKNRLLGLTSYLANPSGVKIFYKPVFVSDVTWSDDGSFDNYIVGTNSVEPVNESTIDCHNQIVSLGPLLQAALNRDVYFINAAYGGTSLAPSGGAQDWEPVLTKQERYFTALNYLHRCISELIAAGKKPKVFMMWHQGEADAQDATARANYQTNFDAFITAMRAQSPYLTSAPLLITQIAYAGGPNEAAINTALQAYVAANPTNSYIFDVASQVSVANKKNLSLAIRTTYPPTASDDDHNTYEFQVKKGELYYAKLNQIGFLQGYTPVVETYEYEVQRWLERLAAAGVTAPSAGNIAKINTVIAGIKAINSTCFKKLNGILFAAQDGSAEASLYNVKNAHWPVATLTGSPTWTSIQGFPWNGTTQYLNAIFNFESHVGGTYYNNMCIGQLVHAISTKISFGINAAGSNNDLYMHNPPASSSLRCWNSTAVAPIAGYTTNTKFFALDRGLSTEYDYYIDAVRTNVAVARAGNSNQAVKFGYNNLIFGNETFSVGFWGQHMTETEMLAIRTLLVNYKASL